MACLTYSSSGIVFTLINIYPDGRVEGVSGSVSGQIPNELAEQIFAEADEAIGSPDSSGLGGCFSYNDKTYSIHQLPTAYNVITNRSWVKP
jgi:hypothetical protein